MRYHEADRCFSVIRVEGEEAQSGKAGVPSVPPDTDGWSGQPLNAGVGLPAAGDAASTSSRCSEHPHRADGRRRSRAAVDVRWRDSTPTLDRILGEGIGYNRFHTTALCSPSRASLLTGRNHHKVCTGVITEFANDWDAFSGRIPKSSALVAEVLKDYGYATAGWGKWHNTPAIEAGPTGPFEYWPTNSGFEYFYGFLAGESSQFEPNLVRNTTFVLPSKTPDEGYHLNEDLADDAIGWLHKHKAMAPDRPFFMYWASGAIHGPPTMHPRSTSTSTGASSTTAGTPTGSAYSSGPRTRAGSHAKRN